MATKTKLRLHLQLSQCWARFLQDMGRKPGPDDLSSWHPRCEKPGQRNCVPKQKIKNENRFRSCLIVQRQRVECIYKPRSSNTQATSRQTDIRCYDCAPIVVQNDHTILMKQRLQDWLSALKHSWHSRHCRVGPAQGAGLTQSVASLVTRADRVAPRTLTKPNL